MKDNWKTLFFQRDGGWVGAKSRVIKCIYDGSIILHILWYTEEFAVQYIHSVFKVFATFC